MTRQPYSHPKDIPTISQENNNRLKGARASQRDAIAAYAFPQMAKGGGLTPRIILMWEWRHFSSLALI